MPPEPLASDIFVNPPHLNTFHSPCTYREQEIPVLFCMAIYCLYYFAVFLDSAWRHSRVTVCCPKCWHFWPMSRAAGLSWTPWRAASPSAWLVRTQPLMGKTYNDKILCTIRTYQVDLVLQFNIQSYTGTSWFSWLCSFAVRPQCFLRLQP